MIFQDIIFLCDSQDCLSKSAFWKELRLSLYDLRDSAFKHDVKVRVNFSVISEAGSRDFKFYDFDTFSVSKENQGELFAKHTWDDLKTYFKSVKNTELNYSQKIIYLKSSEVTPELTEKAELYSLLKLEKVRIVTVRSTTLDDYSKSIHKTINKKGAAFGKVFSKKIAISFAAAVLAVALVSSAPMLVRQIKKMSVRYEKVYTGDGDRLIMRSGSGKEFDEIIRLHENEVVQLIKHGDEWDEVNYHGLTGFCHKEYFVPAKAEDYEIKNPEAVFLFGMACRKFNIPDQDWKTLLQKASLSDVISSTWELVRDYNVLGQSQEYEILLKRIDNSRDCVEDRNIQKWRQMAKDYKNQGDQELYIKFTNKAKELEADVKVIRQQAAKRLSEYYLDKYSHAQDASDYYKRAIDLGLKPKNDYMYKLAMKDELADTDTMYWLKKASAAGHGESSYWLAEYYDNKGYYNDAITFYTRSYNAGYKAKSSAYAIGIIYWNKYTSYVSAFTWFDRVASYNDSSFQDVNACYALGQYYEYGYGGYKNMNNAMYYYKRAAVSIAAAGEAYKRLQKNYGGYDSWY